MYQIGEDSVVGTQKKAPGPHRSRGLVKKRLCCRCWRYIDDDFVGIETTARHFRLCAEDVHDRVVRNVGEHPRANRHVCRIHKQDACSIGKANVDQRRVLVAQHQLEPHLDLILRHRRYGSGQQRVLRLLNEYEGRPEIRVFRIAHCQPNAFDLDVGAEHKLAAVGRAVCVVELRLRLQFDNEADYDKIREDDTFNFVDIDSFAPDKPLTIEAVHADGSKDVIRANHSYNATQISWFREGSALNLIKKENA